MADSCLTLAGLTGLGEGKEIGRGSEARLALLFPRVQPPVKVAGVILLAGQTEPLNSPSDILQSEHFISTFQSCFLKATLKK
jgi:hypothetical protein